MNDKMVNPEAYPFYNSLKKTTDPERPSIEFLDVERLKNETDSFMNRMVEKYNTGIFPDTIFFMDRSARPIGQMFMDLLPSYLPEAPMPEIRYVNMGGQRSKEKRPNSRPFDADPSIINEVYGSHINQSGNILLVDEFSYDNKREAIARAAEIFTKAFPNAKIKTDVVYSALPNWYNNPKYLGVDTYSIKDYQEMALSRFNIEMRLNLPLEVFISPKEDYPGLPEFSRKKFNSYLEEVISTSPYTKGAMLNEVQREFLRNSRKELRRICQEIKAAKNLERN